MHRYFGTVKLWIFTLRILVTRLVNSQQARLYQSRTNLVILSFWIVHECIVPYAIMLQGLLSAFTRARGTREAYFVSHIPGKHLIIKEVSY